jgi:hypothetical protein
MVDGPGAVGLPGGRQTAGRKERIVKSTGRREIKFIEQTPVQFVVPGMPAFDPGLVLPDRLVDVKAQRLEAATNLSEATRNFAKISALYRRRVQQGDTAALEEMLYYAPYLMHHRWVQEAFDRAGRSRRQTRGRGRPYGRSEETRDMTRLIGPLVHAIQTDRCCTVSEALRELAYRMATNRDGDKYKTSRGISERRLRNLYYEERLGDGTLLPYAVRDTSRARVVPARELHPERVYARPGEVLGFRPIVAVVFAPEGFDPQPTFEAPLPADLPWIRMRPAPRG